MTPNMLSTIAIMAIAISAVVYAMAFSSMRTLSLLAAFPILAFFLTHPALLLASAIAVYSSNLKVPQAPPLLTLHYILALVTLACLIPYRILNRRIMPVSSPSRIYLIGFCLVLAVTMYFRGTGIRVFGSQLWGGASYIILLISSLLLLSQDGVCLSSKAWRNTLCAMGILSLLPIMAQVLFTASHGAITRQYEFISTAGAISIVNSLDAVESGTGVARYNTGFGLFLIFVPLIYFQNPWLGVRKIITFGVIMLGMACSGFTGSRFSILEITAFLMIWMLRTGPDNQWKKVVIITVILVTVLSGAAILGRHLPIPVQRAVSFVPFADISQDATVDADATVTWRMDLWKVAVKDIPKYWLLGRGLAFDSRELQAAIYAGFYDRDWALITGSYHNAILSLLLNLGIVGLFFGVAFTVSITSRHYRISKATWHDQLLERIHRVLFALFAAHALLFFTVGGDVQTFGSVIFYAMLLEGVARTKNELDLHQLQNRPENVGGILNSGQ